MLYSMTNSQQASKILEVACGAGLPSSVFLQSYMKNGASYFCCDFAEKMIAETWDRINSSYIKLDPSFEHIEATFEGKTCVDTAIAPFSECDKWCFSFLADNENLPFKDEQFDLYLACLSLMLTTNYKK